MAVSGTETFEAIGTVWEITLPDISVEKHAAVIAIVKDRIALFDSIYSRFRNDSLVTQMAQNSGTYQLPDDAQPLLDLYRELYEKTHGKFTPLIGQTLSDAGYDATYSLKSKELVSPPTWEESLRYDFPTLEIVQPALLDFGAAGKGYLVDIVAELVEQELGNDASYIINAGGDLRVKTDTNTPIKIGLEHPEYPDQVIGVVDLAAGSICGSAGNRRAWGKYHHTIDPNTLESPKHIKAIWVTADTALLADALTTCLYFVAPNELAASYSFEYLLVYENLVFESSENFPAELYT